MINTVAFMESSSYLGHYFTMRSFSLDSGQMGHSIQPIRRRPARVRVSRRVAESPSAGAPVWWSA